jgi:hypothetical protein
MLCLILTGYSLLNEYYRPEDSLTDFGGNEDDNKKPKDTDDAVPNKPENDQGASGLSSDPTTSQKKKDNSSDEDFTNIDKALGEELNEIRNESLKFQSVDTGVKNILFISTTV